MAFKNKDPKRKSDSGKSSARQDMEARKEGSIKYGLDGKAKRRAKVYHAFAEVDFDVIYKTAKNLQPRKESSVLKEASEEFQALQELLGKDKANEYLQVFEKVQHANVGETTHEAEMRELKKFLGNKDDPNSLLATANKKLNVIEQKAAEKAAAPEETAASSSTEPTVDKIEQRARAEAQKARLADERAAAKLEAEQLKADESLQAGQKPITDNKHNQGSNTDGTPIAPPITPAPEVRFLKSTAENEIEQRAKEALRKAREASQLRREEESRRQAEESRGSSTEPTKDQIGQGEHRSSYVKRFLQMQLELTDKTYKKYKDDDKDFWNDNELVKGWYDKANKHHEIQNIHNMDPKKLAELDKLFSQGDTNFLHRMEVHEYKRMLKDGGFDQEVLWSAGSNNAEGEATKTVEINNVLTLKETDHTKAITIEGRAIKEYRSVEFPLKIAEGGPQELMMAFKDENGNNMPENNAVYFGIHYNKHGRIMDMTHPIPLKFSGQGNDNDIGYIEFNGKIYTSPMTRGQYNKIQKIRGGFKRSKDHMLGVPIANSKSSEQMRKLNNAAKKRNPSQDQDHAAILTSPNPRSPNGQGRSGNIGY